jgi:medium-chain acyl-[acyl-carrier-protein] hydrolase
MSHSRCIDARSDHRQWLVRFRPNTTASLRLFCFPYAGMGASMFFPWAQGMHPGIEVVGVQLPGREGRIREKPFESLQRIVQEAAKSIRPYLDRPYSFFGHSMGALIGFELARYLRQEGAPTPAHLFVSARRAPRRPDSLSKIYGLPDAEFIAEIGRRWGGIPSAVLREAELLQLLLPTLRADVAVLETYIHAVGASVDCPISVFGGTGDANITRDDLLAWRDHTRGAFRLRMFPGDHFFLRGRQRDIQNAVVEDLLPLLGDGRNSGEC